MLKISHFITVNNSPDNSVNSSVNSSVDNYNATSLSMRFLQRSYRMMGTLILSGAVLATLTGCGQKGALYLADTDSQMVGSASDETASEVLDSTSNPQDAAFAGIDDNDYQKTRYLEQQQVLPEASDDPNDY